MLSRFRLEEPDTIKEACDLLARFGEDSRVYAGGTELLLAMKEGLLHYERLVNIKKIPALTGVKLRNQSISIGALTTHRKLEGDPLLREHIPSFGQMERKVANVRVREVGTIGGNLCFAEPHADPGTLLLVLGAKLIAENASSWREIPVEQFFVDAYETCLESDELLTEIHIPLPVVRSAATYSKFGYLERPSVGIGLFLAWDQQGAIADVRIAVGAAGPKPRRVEEAEALLKGKIPEEATRMLARVGEIAGRAADTVSDLHGSSEYKEQVIGVLLNRTFQQLSQQILSS